LRELALASEDLENKLAAALDLTLPKAASSFTARAS
jgi:hypothetical protein